MYYNLTFQLFESLHHSLSTTGNDLLSKLNNSLGYQDCCTVDSAIKRKCEIFIDNIYHQLINSLNSAASCAVPLRKEKFLKFWWNEEADALKADSVVTHRAWIDSGRPRNGPIYDRKAKAKLLYKSFIKQNQVKELSNVSNSLHDALMNKDSSSF